jgi:pyrimidine deaminase RibD-like protein
MIGKIDSDDRNDIIQDIKIRLTSTNWYDPKKGAQELTFLSGLPLRRTAWDWLRINRSSHYTLEEIFNNDEFLNEDEQNKTNLNEPFELPVDYELSLKIDKNYLRGAVEIYGNKILPMVRYCETFLYHFFKEMKRNKLLPDLKHFLPNNEFLTKDIPPEFKFLTTVEDYRLNVKGYTIYEKIVQSDERQFMMIAVKALKKCRESFDLQMPSLMDQFRKNEREIRRNIPLLSAVAVDKKGELIKTAYKGEMGCLNHHCEYTLLEEMLTEIEREDLKGGSLYVTLEPCNKRGTYFDKDRLQKAKIPCAVRCIESGISKIFIGTYDPNNVNWKGAEILRTGIYAFDCINGKITGKDEKEKIAACLLQDYFIKNDYPVVESSKQYLKYNIGKPLDEVRFFHPDLSIEIMKLNKEFIGAHVAQAFPNVN